MRLLSFFMALLLACPFSLAETGSAVEKADEKEQGEKVDKPRAPFRALHRLWPFKRPRREKSDDDQYLLREVQRKGPIKRITSLIGFGRPKKPKVAGDNFATAMMRNVTDDASRLVNAFVRNWPTAPGRKNMRPYNPWEQKNVIEVERVEVPILRDDVLKDIEFEVLWSQRILSHDRVRRVQLVQDVVVVETLSRTLFAFDVNSGFPVWTLKFEEEVDFGPLFTAEGMYIISSGLIYYFSQPEVGEYDWRRSMPFVPFTPPGAHMKTFIFGGSGGKLYVYNRKRRSIDWTVPAWGRVNGKPLVAGESVYFATEDGSLMKVSLRSHKYEWKFNNVLGNYSTPPVLDAKANPERVYFGTRGQYLIGVNTSDGTMSKVGDYQEWKILLDGPITKLPVVHGNFVLAVSDYGGLHAIDREKARELWAVPDVVKVVSKSAGNVYCLTKDKRLIAIELSSGKLKWQQDVTPFEFIPSAPERQLVLLATNSGQIFALKPSVGETPVEDIEGLKPTGDGAAKEGEKK